MGKGLEQAVRAAAVKNIASKSTDQILREFRDQGIGSLEDLAKNIVTSAKSAGRSSAAFDDEIFGVCIGIWRIAFRHLCSDYSRPAITHALNSS